MDGKGGPEHRVKRIRRRRGGGRGPIFRPCQQGMRYVKGNGRESRAGLMSVARTWARTWARAIAGTASCDAAPWRDGDDV